jgi:hypothetical protein
MTDTPDLTPEAVERLGPYAVDGGCDAYGAMEHDPHGDYVRYEDYQALAAENARLNATRADELARAYMLGTGDAAKVAAGPYVSQSRYSPESVFYGADMSPDRSDWGRGIQRGRDKSVTSIRTLTPPADLADRVKGGE